MVGDSWLHWPHNLWDSEPLLWGTPRFFSLDTFSVGLVRHLSPFLLSCQASAQGVAASGRDDFKACLEGQPLHLVAGDRE